MIAGRSNVYYRYTNVFDSPLHYAARGAGSGVADEGAMTPFFSKSVSSSPD